MELLVHEVHQVQLEHKDHLDNVDERAEMVKPASQVNCKTPVSFSLSISHHILSHTLCLSVSVRALHRLYFAGVPGINAWMINGTEASKLLSMSLRYFFFSPSHTHFFFLSLFHHLHLRLVAFFHSLSLTHSHLHLCCCTTCCLIGCCFAVAPRMNEKSESPVTVTVQEGDNVRLPCIAEGQPPPRYSWKRSDGKAIRLGQWSSEYSVKLLHECTA